MSSLEQALESIEKSFHGAKGGREDGKENDLSTENGIGEEMEGKARDSANNENLYIMIKLYIALRRRGHTQRVPGCTSASVVSSQKTRTELLSTYNGGAN